MAPDRVGETNMWNVLEDEYFVDQATNEKVQGPLVVRVTDTGIGLLAVQGTTRKYKVPGDKIEDFPLVVKKINP